MKRFLKSILDYCGFFTKCRANVTEYHNQRAQAITTAIATKMSLKNLIFTRLTPSRSIRQMLAIFSEVEF